MLPAAILLSPSHFALVLMVLSAGVLWEWLGLTTLGPGPRCAITSGFVALCASLILSPWVQPQELASLPVLSAVLVWPVVLWIALQRGRSPRGLGGALLAAWAMTVCTAALWVARLEGFDYLLSLMAVVWVADTSAYFAGRAIGGAKLAPSLSPGKTWAGAWGAVAGVLVFGLASAVLWELSWPARLASVLGLEGLAMALVALTVLSIAGDLHQSLLKRQAGVKDSGSLLPGHGGLFDRFDAMLVVVPIGVALGLVLSGSL